MNSEPLIKPAYKGGNRAVSPDDTASTESVSISREIAEFAQSFNWKPVPIYEYLKANIETEWVWGCRKSVEEIRLLSSLLLLDTFLSLP